MKRSLSIATAAAAVTSLHLGVRGDSGFQLGKKACFLR